MSSNDQATRLNRDALNAEERQRYDELKASPVTVLQIGEGNFLRGFFDWMVHESRKKELFPGSIAVTQPRPAGKAKIETLARQDGLYNLVIRGLENGQRVEKRELISVFSQVFDPYSDWAAFLALAENPDLQFVVSNTTEAGLAYRPETLEEGKPLESFPAKLALLLYRRFQAFQGDAEKGLILLPCELIERNGDELKSCVLRYCEDWGLPKDFTHWVKEYNRFLNSLVDRIVTGFPTPETEEWKDKLGYTDEMLNTAEPYYLWAIEAEAALDDKLPFAKAGLNVLWVDDLTRYQVRKVRILNGAHTLMTPIAILNGFDIVRDVMENAEFGAFVRETVEREIIPTLPFPENEMKDYAATVYERFLNPFIDHRLADIAMNSISKFKTRLVPSLSFYAERGKPLPDGLLKAFAALLLYYKVRKSGDGFEGTTLAGKSYTVRDDAKVLEILHGIWAEDGRGGQTVDTTVSRLLASVAVWGKDLSAFEGLSEGISVHLKEWEGQRHE